MGSHSLSFRASKQQKEGTVTDRASWWGCQKREAFFLSSFRFHRASLPNSSGDMAKTLEKSSADKCLCGDMGNWVTKEVASTASKSKGTPLGGLSPVPGIFLAYLKPHAVHTWRQLSSPLVGHHQHLIGIDLERQREPS